MSRGIRFPPKGSVGWMSPIELRPLYLRILERYPAAADFEPCECGVTLAVVLARYVRADIHFVIDDEEFRREALQLIATHALPNTADADGVLILGERA